MDSDITVCDRSCSVLLCGVKRFDPMKFYWNDVELTEEEYNQKWKEWLEYLKANEEKEEEQKPKKTRKKK